MAALSASQWEEIGWTVEDLDLMLKNVTFRRK